MTNEQFFAAEFERLYCEENDFADACNEDFERLLAADEAIAEWRKSYPPALCEAVEEKRPMTWVSGLPGVWGAHNTPVRELWV